MAKRDKLDQWIRSLPVEADYDDLARWLVQNGWIFHRSRGSHHVWSLSNGASVTIPLVSGRYVKRRYVKQVVELTGETTEGE